MYVLMLIVCDFIDWYDITKFTCYCNWVSKLILINNSEIVAISEQNRKHNFKVNSSVRRVVLHLKLFNP